MHHAQPTAISLTQATERGTVYSRGELQAISEVARKTRPQIAYRRRALRQRACASGLLARRPHLARGVDALSFGATKNGALGAEAVIFFHEKDVADFEYRRKKSGHLLSKMRFLSAQLDAYLEDDRWLKAAGARQRARAKTRNRGCANSRRRTRAPGRGQCAVRAPAR